MNLHVKYIQLAKFLAAITLFSMLVASLASAQVDVLYLYTSNVNQSNTTITDMCSAIALAASKYPGLTLDARGFSGNQYCSAANANTMLGSASTGLPGKLLLGNVTIVIDGPPTISASGCERNLSNVLTISFASSLPAGVTFGA